LAGQRLAPLAEALRGGGGLPPARRLVVVPSGWLSGIPVEALTDQYTVSYIPSGTLFARLAEQRRPGGVPSLLALGDPAFATAEGQPAPEPLPGTRREVKAVAALFPRSVVLLGADAGRSRLDELRAANRLPEFRYLHFATHGRADTAREFESALVLAADSRLTARAVLEGWELDAELVTLSACETGLGRRGGGEGLLGFGQAFLLAGTRAVVLSLWKVDDTVTPLLMTRFYQNLLGKRDGLDKPLPRGEALREAKKWLRELTAEGIDQEVARLPKAERGEVRARPQAVTPEAHPFAHPYYWSAFILIGDPD
jgi:CHAT domain-containing protein